jgi:hypothetical protein
MRILNILEQLNSLSSHKKLLGFEVDLWIGCPLAIVDHAKESRVYAHTGHQYGTICICENLNFLSLPYQYGIMAHEMGHILAEVHWNDDTEHGADMASKQFLGLSIQYGEKNIQYLSQDQITFLKIRGWDG